MTQLPLPILDVAEAVRRLGGPSAVARSLMEQGLRERITPQAISDWVARGYAPPDLALWLETGSGIPREHLIAPYLQPLITAPSAV